MKHLKFEAYEYFKAMKWMKQMAALSTDAAESHMVAVTLEALRYAALRAENPPLTRNHLKQMHGQAVYCSSWTGGPTGGGIIDANKEQVILLDHNGACRDTWFWNSTGKYYRFPLNGVDLLGPDGLD